ncbi:MAG: hypothetical protein AAFY41_03235 [Bacteroidota bacterium]
MKNTIMLTILMYFPVFGNAQWNCSGSGCSGMKTSKHFAWLNTNSKGNANESNFHFYVGKGWLKVEGDDVILTPRRGRAIIEGRGTLYAHDYLHAKNRLISDGDIELPANRVIRKRGSGSGHLSFTGFTEYRFDKPLSDPNSNLVLNDNVDITNDLSFGNRPRQMLNLWGTQFGIGIQSQTMYFRTNNGANEGFAWYHGGQHSTNGGGFGQNGGGKTYMVLRKGRLGVGENLGDGFIPTHTLDVDGTSSFRDLATFDAGADVTGTLKNQHIQINSDRISADGLAGTQDLLLTDNHGINLRSDNIIIENEDGTSTSDVLTIRSTNTMLETNLYGENGTVTFKDAVFIESTNGLTVKETINTQDLNVTPGAAPGAPDYVFKKDYDLRSLEEVQKHIKKKGHLPEVPSAKQIEEEGYTMVEMDFTLLKKVEELTLYVLDLKKENDKQAQQIEKLVEENEKLNVRINESFKQKCNEK